jgi:hypothetical protein
MPFCSDDFTHRYQLLCWNGERYVHREVLQVSNVYTRYISLDSAVPGTIVGQSWTMEVYGTGIFWDPVSREILYVSKRQVFKQINDLHSVYIQMLTGHKLYDLARKIDRERQALKDAFAELIGSSLSLDTLRHIYRFC